MSLTHALTGAKTTHCGILPVGQNNSANKQHAVQSGVEQKRPGRSIISAKVPHPRPALKLKQPAAARPRPSTAPFPPGPAATRRLPTLPHQRLEDRGQVGAGAGARVALCKLLVEVGEPRGRAGLDRLERAPVGGGLLGDQLLGLMRLIGRGGWGWLRLEGWGWESAGEQLVWRARGRRAARRLPLAGLSVTPAGRPPHLRLHLVEVGGVDLVVLLPLGLELLAAGGSSCRARRQDRWLGAAAVCCWSSQSHPSSAARPPAPITLPLKYSQNQCGTAIKHICRPPFRTAR
jgi:hypothetical protein